MRAGTPARTDQSSEESVYSDEVSKVASPRKLINILLAESELSILNASLGRDDAGSGVVQDIVAWRRSRSRRLESIDDSEAKEPNHPSSGDGSRAEMHLLDLMNGENALLEQLFQQLSITIGKSP